MAPPAQNVSHRLTVASSLTSPTPQLSCPPPFQLPGPATMRVAFGTVDGLRIRYAESEGPAERTILLTNPWPESLYAFRPIWRQLARRFRLFAIDLPGFGASECRQSLLSPRAMGGFLARAIDELELGRPHLVAPDIGCAAALFAAATAPTSVASLAVGTGPVAVPANLGRLPRDGTSEPEFASHHGCDVAAIIGAVLESSAGYVSNPVREDYLRSYAGGRFLESMRYLRRLPLEWPELADLLPELAVSVLVFSGSRERPVPPANLESLAARLPRSRQAIIGAGHFVWEEAPDAFSEMISDWVSEGHRSAAGSRSSGERGGVAGSGGGHDASALPAAGTQLAGS